jgi:P27 family predicted phage terminase small subunit
MAYKGRKSASKVLPFPSRPQLIENIRAPSYLAPEEQKLYDRIASDYDIRSNSAAVILEIACQNHARARNCRDVLKKEGLTVAGPNGVKAHPLLATERQAQAQMITALRRLGVTLDEG